MAKSQLDSATLIRTIRNTLAFHPQDQQTAPQSLRKRSRAVERSTDTIFITDLHGVIEYGNPAFENLTGQERDEVCGRASRISKSSERAPEVYHKIRRRFLPVIPTAGSAENRKKNGESYYVEESICPVRDALRQVTQFLSKGVISLRDYGWKPSFCRPKRGMRWGIWRPV